MFEYGSGGHRLLFSVHDLFRFCVVEYGSGFCSLFMISLGLGFVWLNMDLVVIGLFSVHDLFMFWMVEYGSGDNRCCIVEYGFVFQSSYILCFGWLNMDLGSCLFLVCFSRAANLHLERRMG
ncbi:hypothetical protein CFOL_v3_15772 [Cephalotus follicularis]|uniref:Uncharacterized protein n=1 Tax=Cephalotus follicularis TaxID=3775 RepID=A0A1Q3BW86_CEPFO|nr:hypothetical protein CFOL_v3_15772 [Cephalotus follicularis]